VSISSTNLQAAFLYEYVIRTFYVLTVSKAAHKMLVKLTEGANFINVLRVAFTCAYPKSEKDTDDLTAIFALLGSGCVKAARKMLVKLATGGR